MCEFFKSVKDNSCYTIKNDIDGIFDRADSAVINVSKNWNQDNYV